MLLPLIYNLYFDYILLIDYILSYISSFIIFIYFENKFYNLDSELAKNIHLFVKFYPKIWVQYTKKPIL